MIGTILIITGIILNIFATLLLFKSNSGKRKKMKDIPFNKQLSYLTGNCFLITYWPYCQL